MVSPTIQPCDDREGRGRVTTIDEQQSRLRRATATEPTVRRRRTLHRIPEHLRHEDVVRGIVASIVELNRAVEHLLRLLLRLEDPVERFGDAAVVSYVGARVLEGMLEDEANCRGAYRTQQTTNHEAELHKSDCALIGNPEAEAEIGRSREPRAQSSQKPKLSVDVLAGIELFS